MQAEAHAAAARAGLRAAARDIERADSPTGWSVGYVTASWQHQTGLALAHLGDLTAAETHLTQAVAGRTHTENRNRALTGIRLAAVQVRRGRPDKAAATVDSLTPDLAVVDSARVRGELAALLAAWQPYGSEPDVRAADDHVAAVTRFQRD